MGRGWNRLEMTREQQIRLRASWIPEKARRYVRILDAMNDENRDGPLRDLVYRSDQLMRSMNNDEMQAATSILRAMEREDQLRRAATT